MGSLPLVLRLRLPNSNNFRGFNFLFFEPIRLLLNPSFKIISPCTRKFNVKCSIVTSKKELDEDFPNKKKKKKIVSGGPKVLVEHLNGKLTSMYLEEAQKLAKRKGLQLLSLDSIGEKNTYKLIGTEALFEENTPVKNHTTKKFLISTNINNNDLKIKFVQISKLLNKEKAVSIVLQNSGSDSSVMEPLITQVENEFKDKFKLHKSKVKNGCKFELSPIVTDKKESDEKIEKKNEEKNQNESKNQTTAQ